MRQISFILFRPILALIGQILVPFLAIVAQKEHNEPTEDTPIAMKSERDTVVS